jgi:hypothetical protein
MKSSVEGAYFFEWGQLRKRLRKLGVPPAECDARRHEIHVQVIGRDKSHTKFTPRETNAVIKKFRELSGSLNTADYERGNRIYVIRQICAGLGKGQEYAQGIADRMDFDHERPRRSRGQTDGEFEMAKWEAELQRGPTARRLLRELKPAELDKVIVALREYRGCGVIHEPETASAAAHPF